MKTAKMVYRECNEFRVTTFERQKILHLIVLHCQLIAFLLITVNELDLPRGWSQRGFGPMPGPMSGGGLKSGGPAIGGWCPIRAGISPSGGLVGSPIMGGNRGAGPGNDGRSPMLL
jgi:hypothetical protein